MTLSSYKYRILMISIIILFTSGVKGQNDIDVILKAKALAASGRNTDAINLLDKAIALETDYRLHIQRAEVCLEEKDYSGAIMDLNQANKLKEHSGDFRLAKVYALKGDAATSLYHLGMHMNSKYKLSEKEIMLEPAFGRIENRSEWRQFWKKEWYNFAERSRSEIEFLTSGNKIEDSKAIFAELKKGYPDSEETLYSETLINVVSGKYNDAVLTARQLTTTYPENEKYMRLLARAQTGQLNYAGASVTYSKLLESGVADARLIISRADCYRETGEIDKAIRDIEKFLELYPEDKYALSLAGKVETESGDNLKALEYFSKNLKLHPNDADCYVDRANSYFVSKSWEWAADDYSMSLDLKPDNSDVWLNKGITLINRGEIDDACHDFKRSYSLGNQKASSYIGKYCINR